MVLLTQNERDIIEGSKEVKKGYRRQVIFKAKHKADEALGDLTFLARSERLSEKTKREIFKEKALGDLIGSVLAFEYVRHGSHRLPLALGRKWPLKPNWKSMGGIPVLGGRWVTVGGVARDAAGSPVKRNDILMRLRIAHRMLRTIHQKLSLGYLRRHERQALWLNREGAKMSLRFSRYRVYTQKVTRYNLQRKETEEIEEQWISLPIKGQNPNSISVIVIEDNGDFNEASQEKIAK